MDEVTLPELLDPVGRWDARRMARFIGTDIEDLAEILGQDSDVVRAHPSAPALQENLDQVAFILRGLLEVTGGDRSTVLIWLNAPHPVLDDESPLDLMRHGELGVVVNLVDDLLSGAPA